MFLDQTHISEAREFAGGQGAPIPCGPCRAVLDAFRENILAVVETASIPYAIAQEGAILNILQRTQMAALFKAKAHAIRNRREHDENFVAEFAKQEFDRMCDAEREGHLVAKDKLGEISLKIAAEGGAFNKAAEELLRQSSVLLWSSAEVLLRDLFKALCNSHSKFFVEFRSKMQDNEKTRKRFDFKISFETLEKYGFNGERSLGDIFLEHNQIQDFDTLLGAVRAVLDCERAEFDKVAMSETWKLYFRRHLIVHRRGIIDSEHASRLGEDGNIGEKLKISPKTFQVSLDAVVSLGRVLETHVAMRHSELKELAGPLDRPATQ